MQVTTGRFGLTVVLHLDGRLTAEADTRVLDDLLQSFAALGPCQVVLDLDNVPQLDCSGIGRLVHLRNRICEAGGAFGLINVHPRLGSLLRMAGLLEAIPMFDDRSEARTWRRRTAGRDVRLSLESLEPAPSIGAELGYTLQLSGDRR